MPQLCLKVEPITESTVNAVEFIRRCFGCLGQKSPELKLADVKVKGVKIIPKDDPDNIYGGVHVVPANNPTSKAGANVLIEMVEVLMECKLGWAFNKKMSIDIRQPKNNKEYYGNPLSRSKFNLIFSRSTVL